MGGGGGRKHKTITVVADSSTLTDEGHCRYTAYLPRTSDRKWLPVIPHDDDVDALEDLPHGAELACHQRILPTAVCVRVYHWVTTTREQEAYLRSSAQSSAWSQLGSPVAGTPHRTRRTRPSLAAAGRLSLATPSSFFLRLSEPPGVFALLPSAERCAALAKPRGFFLSS